MSKKKGIPLSATLSKAYGGERNARIVVKEIAGTVGDPAELAKLDRLRQTLQRHLDDPHGVTAEAEQRAAQAEQRALRRGGKLGRTTARTKFIRKLVADHPDKTAGELYTAASSKVGERGSLTYQMKKRTFANQVTEARKFLKSLPTAKP
jgi:hypothetical protein